MKKLLFMSCMLASMLSAQQATGQKTYYWPNERATELTSGTQYFLFNTTRAGNNNEDRSWLGHSNGTDLKTSNIAPKDQLTTSTSFLFTAEKPTSPKSTNHWYLKSGSKYVSINGKTNNASACDLYISKWFGNENVSKAGVKSENTDGTIEDPQTKDLHVWTITKIDGKNTNTNDNSYAWNGNPAGSGSAWASWSTAHPYAFYTVGSRTLSAEAAKYYDEKTNRNGIFEELAFNLQKAHGLVQNGNKYFSNYPETTPAEHSSYANLIDGNDNTIFHSSWSAPGNANDPKHYLRAEFSTPKTEFYFITKRRCNNNNNRPIKMLIEGSQDDQTYKTIKTIETGMPSAATEFFYFSDKITTTEAYKYIRFTPQATNTNTRFFTYSEFYVIEANASSDAAISAAKTLYSMKDADIKTNTNIEATIIANGKEVSTQNSKIGSDIEKKKGQALLEANKTNHAETPALGQYPTSAYNALQQAINNTSITYEALKKAISDFYQSINAPVFTINGTFDANTYKTIGKSIYHKANDQSTPLWWDKATNIYDKTMLWMFAGATGETVDTGKKYSVINMGTNAYFWNVDTLKIEQTVPANQKNIVLLYTNDNNDPVHAQNGGRIVHWNNKADNSASGWTLSYVGNSYDIKKINVEDLNTFSSLNTLVKKCEPYSTKLGNGLNQFSNNTGFAEAYTTAKALTDKGIYKNSAFDAAACKQAYTNLQQKFNALKHNMPQSGKFYRFKGSTGMYISAKAKTLGNSNQAFMTSNANEAVFYLTKDMKLVTADALCMNEVNSVAGLGSVTQFASSDVVVGKYVIYNNKKNYSDGNLNTNKDLNKYTGDISIGKAKIDAAWTIEEVTDVNLQPKLTKTITAQYATLGAPVALNIPEGIKAYTVKVENNTALLTEVNQVIPAGTAVVLEKVGSPASNDFNFTFAAEGTATTSLLKGAYIDTAVATSENAYVLGQNTAGVYGFFKLSANDRTLAKNKAYLVLPQNAAAPASILIGGKTTGIEDAVTETAEEVYFDLQGRRVQNPTKGIYVTKSGKKVLFY